MQRVIEEERGEKWGKPEVWERFNHRESEGRETTHQLSPELVQDSLDWSEDKEILDPAGQGPSFVEDIGNGAFLPLQEDG